MRFIYLYLLTESSTFKSNQQTAVRCVVDKQGMSCWFFSEVPQDRRKKGMLVINFESKWLKYVPRVFWSKSASLNIYAVFYCTDSNIE